MSPRTYETVSFTDRLTEAINQIKEVQREIASMSIRELSTEPKVLRECSSRLLDSIDTLHVLRKELLFYISQ